MATIHKRANVTITDIPTNLTYYSGEYAYKKLIDSAEHDYNYWDEQCRGEYIVVIKH